MCSAQPAAAPAQERLVTASEEPVDMAAVDETDTAANALPGVTTNALPAVTERRHDRARRPRIGSTRSPADTDDAQRKT